ncbi:glycosyltransferase [Lentzea sp.]|uniref:glycosyltransferase n=1 Tax=Lentzea sp. TaxID=56099 RepID=UPI002B9E7CBE|nr:glycosyltransferase [Lentzea sp.]HUQ56365.1 glycosyltransferase [Lentzea sp.]
MLDGTGLRVPPRDPGAIAEALRTLLPNDARRQRLGAAGRDRTRARYSWDHIASELVRVCTAVGRTAPAATRPSHVD